MARKKKENVKAVDTKIKKGGIFFSNEINVEVDVNTEAPTGEKITKVVNLFDGQILGGGGAPTISNALIKSATQTYNDDFCVDFEVELTDEETAFVNSHTTHAVNFLCRDLNGTPTILKNIGRKQTSYAYYITSESGFLAIYTNNSGGDTLANVFDNSGHQKCITSLDGNKIKIRLINSTDAETGTVLGYVSLPDGYVWDVTIVAF